MTAFLLSALASWLLGFLVYGLLFRLRILDRPNRRSSHTKPTVRGGGIAILTAITGVYWGVERGGAGGFPLALFGLAGALAVVSFIDDLRSLKPSLRFGCQILVAAGVLCALHWGGPNLGPGNLGLLFRAGFMLICLLWLVGYTNAFNFMDGINGIAGGQVAVTGLGTAAVAMVSGLPSRHPAVMLSLVLAGAAAGFLPHNFPRARMFMGDVGSAPLGFLLAALALWIARDLSWWLLVPLGLLHANFVFDTAITLIRRIVRGENWREAHREHFYQRLVRAGCTHTMVTGWEMGLQILVIATVVWSVRLGPAWVWLPAVIALTVWGSFFAVAERAFVQAKDSVERGTG